MILVFWSLTYFFWHFSVSRFSTPQIDAKLSFLSILYIWIIIVRLRLNIDYNNLLLITRGLKYNPEIMISSRKITLKAKMVFFRVTRPEGLEPSTSGFGDRRSTN